MKSRLAFGGLVAALVLLIPAPLGAQVDTRDRRLPLGPNRPAGEAVAPFVEGWYENADGTYTFSFGYFNLNTREALHIPIGPNNRIEPAELNGMQPTYFPAPTPRDPTARRGRAGYERRERGVFTLTVPAEYRDRRPVVWTLTANGETHQVAARVGHSALHLNYQPMAMGSVPPLLGFRENGARGQHPTGITLEETLTTSVGRALTLSVWVSDPSQRSPELLGVLYRDVPIRLTWFLHQGPAGAQVIFERPADEPVAPAGAREGREASEEETLDPYQNRLPPTGGRATTGATFSQPGDYVLRVRADNFTAEDSTPGDQCCWTNGYIKVRVAP